MIAVTGILAAGGVGVALGFRDKIRKALFGLVEWGGRSGKNVVIGGRTMAVTGAIAGLSLAFVGGAGVSLGVFGGTGTGVASVVSPPSTPTVDISVFAPTGDSMRVIGSPANPDGADTHDSTKIQVDSVSKDFTSPQYHNVVLGPVETDTALITGDSGAVVITRIAYKGATGGWSEWSAWDTTTMEYLSFVTPDWYTGWESGGVDDGSNDSVGVVMEGGLMAGNVANCCTYTGTGYTHLQAADTHAARLNYRCPGSGACDERRVSFWLNANDDTLYKEVWIEWNHWWPDHLKFPNTPSNNKWMEVWGDTTSGNSTLGQSFTDCPSSFGGGVTCTMFNMQITPDAGNDSVADLFGGQFSFSGQNGSGFPGTPANGSISYPRGTAKWSREHDLGTWVNVKVHLKVSSALTDSSAEIHLCKNDTIFASMPAGTDVWFADDPAGDGGGNGFNAVYLGGYFNSVFGDTTAIHIDSISTWWDTNEPMHWPSGCR